MTSRPSTPAPSQFDRPGLFPDLEQFLVLRAALDDGRAALDAYQEWRATLDLSNDFDREVFRLVPLLYDNLRRLGHHDELMGRLKGTYRLAWAKNHRLFDDTRPVLDRFVAAGLTVMAMKGAPLALCYYANPAARPMSDVDFVVPESQVDTAAGILVELGYRPWRTIDRDFRRFRHAVGFLAPGQKEIDLHWHVLLDFCDDSADTVFWRTARPFRFLEQDILAPDATRLLLLTIIHGLRWNPEPPVRWIPDALMILRQSREPIDWAWIVGFAVERRVTFRLRTGLAYLAAHFSGDIPAWVLARLHAVRPSARERLELRTLMTAFSYDSPMGPLLDALSEFPRLPRAGSAFAAANRFAHFLRFHWGLAGRREIPLRLARGFRRRAASGRTAGRG